MPSKSLGAVTQNGPLHSALWTKLTTATASPLLGYSQVTKPRGETKTDALMCHTTSPSSLESAHPTFGHQAQRSIIPQNPRWERALLIKPPLVIHLSMATAAANSTRIPSFPPGNPGCTTSCLGTCYHSQATS